MSGTAVIVDYGVGNLRSVARAVAACGSEPVLASNAAKIDRAEKIILPGVGAFASCVEALDAHSLKEPVLRAMNDNRPILGICVGMQMLLDKSEEFGEHAGLGRIAGSVVAIPREGVDGVQHKIPHVGWSPLQPSGAGWKGTLCTRSRRDRNGPMSSSRYVTTTESRSARRCALATSMVYNFIPRRAGP
jgi:glutamine amidotransferase